MAINNSLNSNLANCSGLPVPGGLNASGTPSSSTFLRGDGAWGTAASITSGSFTPTATFLNPGDLSVSYAVQQGIYYRIGDMVFIQIQIQFTPTYTTASGLFRITSLPFTVTSLAGATQWNITVLPQSNATYGTSMTWVGGWFEPNTSNIRLQGMAASATPVGYTQAGGQIPSGSARTFTISGFYQTT